MVNTCLFEYKTHFSIFSLFWCVFVCACVLVFVYLVLAELEGLGKGAAATADRSRLERVSTEAK